MLEAINIPATNTSPKVIFDPLNNIFEISGDSRPENVQKFYEPLLTWLSSFTGEALEQMGREGKYPPMQIKINLEYFNSSSAKYIMLLFQKFKILHKAHLDLKILWYYKEFDHDQKAAGAEFAKLFNLNINFVQIK